MANESFYTKLQETADKLIRDKGQTIVITQSGTTYSGYAIEGTIGIGAAKIGSESFQQATMVRQSNRKLVVSAKDLGVVPRPGDTVTIGGDSINWQINGVLPINPGGVVVYYELAVEK